MIMSKREGEKERRREGEKERRRKNAGMREKNSYAVNCVWF